LYSVFCVWYTELIHVSVISWPSLGSYKFGRCLQLIWQLVINNWQAIYYLYNETYENTMIIVAICVINMKIGSYNVKIVL